MALIDRFVGSLPSFLQPSGQGTPVAAPTPTFARDAYSFNNALAPQQQPAQGGLDALFQSFMAQIEQLKQQIATLKPAALDNTGMGPGPTPVPPPAPPPVPPAPPPLPPVPPAPPAPPPPPPALPSLPQANTLPPVAVQPYAPSVQGQPPYIPTPAPAPSYTPPAYVAPTPYTPAPYTPSTPVQPVQPVTPAPATVTPQPLPPAAGPNTPLVAPTDAASLRAQAERIWVGSADSQETSHDRIERDPTSVNKLDAAHQQQAQSLLGSSQALEAQARAALTPQQQAEYDALAAVTQNDPNARLALRLLLAEGTLTGADRSLNNRNLLDELSALNASPVASGIDKAALLSDLIQELAMPSAINQWNRGTCTVTTLQIFMAMKRPAELVRIIGGLAGPAGSVNLASGQVARRFPGTETSDGTQRTISARLWNPAMMQLVLGRSISNSQSDPGLTATEVGKAYQAVTGKSVQTFTVSRDGFDAVIAHIREATARGLPVPIGRSWGSGGHELLVTRVVGDRLYMNNPQGTEDSITIGELRSVLWSTNVVDL